MNLAVGAQRLIARIRVDIAVDSGATSFSWSDERVGTSPTPRTQHVAVNHRFEITAFVGVSGS